EGAVERRLLEPYAAFAVRGDAGRAQSAARFLGGGVGAGGERGIERASGERAAGAELGRRARGERGVQRGGLVAERERQLELHRAAARDRPGREVEFADGVAQVLDVLVPAHDAVADANTRDLEGPF